MFVLQNSKYGLYKSKIWLLKNKTKETKTNQMNIIPRFLEISEKYIKISFIIASSYFQEWNLKIIVLKENMNLMMTTVINPKFGC